ncbi:MAG TPA: DUF2298 domain-containing protein, partial [Thermomicrobiales bacterium]|nr:DUF2298 domain-containing protein [Thermomicrobiales bacterium]
RLMESVRQSPWRYPVQIRYYDLLTSGQLGFTLAADFHTEPKIGPLKFDDSLADESWVNYDHPRVLIFKKGALIDQDTYQTLMTPAIDSNWTPTRLNEHAKTLMLDEPVGQLPVVGDFRWSERWTHNSAVALGVWIVLLALFGVIGRQWSRLLFPRFPDGGAGMSRVLTLIIAGWLLWFLASLKIVAFEVWWCWAALAVIAAIGFALWWLLADRRRDYPLPAVAGAEVAFWSVFALFLLFRWINPDSWHPIWGGEKPMEFAHLNATLRSAHFPPFDPWFANGYINYYYYGLYLVAYCIKLTGIPAEIAFNLAQPTMMGLAASGAYTLAAALGSTRRRVSQAVATGLLGATLLVLIGNLDTFFHVLKTWPDQINPNFDWTWGPSRAISNAITEFPYFTGLYADLHAHGINVPISLAVLAICLSLAQDPNLTTITTLRPRANRETFGLLVRLGMLGLGVGSVATTNSWDLAEYVLFTFVALFMTTVGIRPFLLRAGLTVFATGVVGAIAAVLFSPFYSKYVALFTTVGETRDKTSVIQFADHLGGLLAIVGVGGSALLLARLRGRISWFVVDPLLPLGIVAVVLIVAIATNLGDADSNSLTVNLATIVACAILAVPSLLVISDQQFDWLDDLCHGIVIAALVTEAVLVVDGRGVLALAVAFFVLGATMWLFLDDRGERLVGAMIACAAGVFGAIEIVFLEDNLSGGDAYRMNTIFKFYNQVWVLLAVAGAVVLGKAMAGSGLLGWLTGARDLGIVAGPFRPTGDGTQQSVENDTVAGELIEEAAADDELAELGPVAELDVWDEDEWTREDETVDLEEPGLMRRRWSRAGVIVGVVVIAMSLFYPVFATRPRLDQRFEGHPAPDTLNSYDWMRYGTIVGGNGDTIHFAGDHDAVYWFINNVSGSPVLMEAAIGPYRGNGSRFSINTGLPDVIGWGNHETQQRYNDDIGPREQEVREFYGTTDLNRKREILAKYDVGYVIVGDVERFTAFNGEYWADPAGIAAIEQMVGTDLEVAFQSQGTTVYRVVGSEP